MAVKDTTEQPDGAHWMPGESAVTAGVPVVSVTTTDTLVPAHSAIFDEVGPYEPGLTMFPVIAWETFVLFATFRPLPKVAIVVTGHLASQVVGVFVGVLVGVGVRVDVGVAVSTGVFVGKGVSGMMMLPSRWRE